MRLTFASTCYAFTRHSAVGFIATVARGRIGRRPNRYSGYPRRPVTAEEIASGDIGCTGVNATKRREGEEEEEGEGEGEGVGRRRSRGIRRRGYC
ncbi:hypothetical protein HZH66_001674 [Vespula vulgaris]|uniref:Uncharacterized protein n=1 Tax=Vespula vulgaris TaxID=7454 RepID=A0A834KIG6_VESVU|nr:hypothetical protein HZH66_001674 [Vespula vulgaris]